MAESKNASSSKSSSLDYIELVRKLSTTANKISKETLEGMVKDFAYKGLALKQIQEFVLKISKKYDIQNNVTTAKPAKGNPIVTLSRIVAAFADISLTLLGKVSMPPAITTRGTS